MESECEWNQFLAVWNIRLQYDLWNERYLNYNTELLYSKIDTIADFLPYITTLIKVIVRSITVWYSLITLFGFGDIYRSTSSQMSHTNVLSVLGKNQTHDLSNRVFF